jgi:hypothetical protein
VLAKTEVRFRFGDDRCAVSFVDKTNIRTDFRTVEELIVFSPGAELMSCVMASSVHFALWKKARTECSSIIWP